MRSPIRFAFLLFMLATVMPDLLAAPLPDPRQTAERDAGEMDAGERVSLRARIPPEVRVLRDLAYGAQARQRLDVYLPAQPKNAPVILMVHGGGWSRGDKNVRGVVENKVARWVGRGFIFVSVNYRLVPEADPLAQAADVAAALAYAQDHAAGWGGDPRRFVLMGHSAGAHLVALLEAAPSIAAQAGARPWLATVALDSGAYDVEALMRRPHFPLYDHAFGRDGAAWRLASPQARMERSGGNFLAVCSSRRFYACAESREFVAQAQRYGRRASVLAEDLSHGAINANLGEDNAYTRQVEDFLAALDPAMRQRLR